MATATMTLTAPIHERLTLAQLCAGDCLRFFSQAIRISAYLFRDAGQRAELRASSLELLRAVASSVKQLVIFV